MHGKLGNDLYIFNMGNYISLLVTYPTATWYRVSVCGFMIVCALWLVRNQSNGSPVLMFKRIWNAEEIFLKTKAMVSISQVGFTFVHAHATTREGAERASSSVNEVLYINERQYVAVWSKHVQLPKQYTTGPFYKHGTSEFNLLWLYQAYIWVEKNSSHYVSLLHTPR